MARNILEEIGNKNKVANLYGDSGVKNYKSVFIIDDEESLNDVWFYFSRAEIFENDEIFALINAFYYFVDYLERDHELTKDELRFYIIFEESEINTYWTIYSDYLIFLMEENDFFFHEFDFKKSISEITFKILVKKDPNESDDVSRINFKKELIIYDFITKSDLNKLQELSEKLTLIMLDIGTDGFSKDGVNQIIITLFQYLNVTKKYKEIENISDSLEDLVFLVKTHIDEITSLSSEDDLYVYEELINNLNSWLKQTFITGVEDISFFDDSIRANVETIRSILFPPELQTDNDKDFFSI
jgi:hypothetical protein